MNVEGSENLEKSAENSENLWEQDSILHSKL